MSADRNCADMMKLGQKPRDAKKAWKKVKVRDSVHNHLAKQSTDAR